MTLKEALTYDDVLLVPKRSPVKSRKEVEISSMVTKKIKLNIPFISANMDSITESAMAIAMAMEGGLGIIHQFLSVEDQVREVLKVKRSENIIVEKPYTIGPHKTLKDVKETMEENGIKSLLVVDLSKKLLGMLTRRDILFETDNSKKVEDIMTKFSDLVTAPEGTTVEEAKEILRVNKLEKLPLVDKEGYLKGMMTAKDIIRSAEHPIAAKDKRGRLLVGAAVGVKDYSERVKKLLDADCDIIVVDIAHAHSDLAINTVKNIRREFGDIQLAAGNIATAEAATDLISAGVDALKVGVGPGCFGAGTRILMSNGFYKNVEEIAPGDGVINKYGKSVAVLKSFSTGIRKVRRIRSSIFHESTCVTPDHRYWVGDLNSTSKATLQSRGYARLLQLESKTIPKMSKYKWKQVQDFKQDVLLMPSKINFELMESFNICLKKRSGGNWRTGFTYEPDINLTPCYELGYILGTFLGDGSASVSKYKNSRRGSVKWYFGKNELDIANKLAGCIEKVFNKKCNIYFKKKIIQVIFYYKPLADFLTSFGKHENKELPHEYFVNNKDYLKGLLEGLIDSDGNCEPGGRIRFTNTSKKLIELFGVLCYLVRGFFPNSSAREISIGGLKNADIRNFNLSYRSDIINTGLKRLTEDHQAVKILDSEEVDEPVEVYDLEVDCPTHSFIANNAIVHNSTCVTRLVAGAGVPQLTAVMDVSKIANLEKIPAWADGGLRTSGDVVKSLAAGASASFSGFLFSGTEETPGMTIIKEGRKYKIYRGSASFGMALTRKNRENRDDLNPFDYTPEGVEAMVPFKGSVSEVIKGLIGGLKSGISYCGGRNISEMQKNAEFIKITSGGLKESGYHDVNRV